MLKLSRIIKQFLLCLFIFHLSLPSAFHLQTTKSASSSLLICNTKTNVNNDENIDVNRTNHHDDANNCNTVTNSLIINNSFQCDSKTVNIDYCAVKKVQIPVTSW